MNPMRRILEERLPGQNDVHYEILQAPELSERVDAYTVYINRLKSGASVRGFARVMDKIRDQAEATLAEIQLTKPERNTLTYVEIARVHAISMQEVRQAAEGYLEWLPESWTGGDPIDLTKSPDAKTSVNALYQGPLAMQGGGTSDPEGLQQANGHRHAGPRRARQIPIPGEQGSITISR
jgi:hypothetical protein